MTRLRLRGLLPGMEKGDTEMPDTDWRRPALPQDHQGAGLPLGIVMIVLGFGAVAVPFVAALDGYGVGGGGVTLVIVLPIAAGLILPGAWIVAVSLVLREIRRAAYEAAVRAGEVEARPSGDRPAPFQRWQGR